MKKILILLVFILSVVSFSEEISDEVQNLTQNESLVEGVVVPAIPVTIAPVIENISISDISNEDFIISVIGSLEADPEIMAKMDVLG
ncbi:MAG: hypothetical protein ACRC6E_06975, partial [Fusobacteriaceae bacterium]